MTDDAQDGDEGPAEEPVQLAAGLSYPESPRWHRGHVYFSDVHAYRLARVASGGDLQVLLHVPGRPAGLGVLSDGRLLLATALDRRLLVVDGTSATEHADLSGRTTGLLNDMVVDSRDRAWVGDTGHELGAPARPGALLRCDPDGAVTTVASDLLFPNGLAISADGKRLYVAETFGRRISVFDIDSAGSLHGRRVVATLPGIPDGICLDEQENLWIALPEQQRFVLLSGDGQLVDEIVTTPWRAVACVLAGPGRRFLFQCLASIKEHADGTVRHGRLQSSQVAVAGAGLP